MSTRSEWLCDTSELNRICAALSRVTGMAQMEILENEVAAILQRALSRTKSARAQQIREAYAKKTWTHLDKKRYYLKNRYPDELWARIVEARKETLRKRLQRRGLSKQSWEMLAQAMGMTIAAPAFVKNANVNGRKFRENVLANKGTSRDKPFIEGTNRAPSVDTPGAAGRSALQGAISGRVKFFEKNLAEGVFRDVREIAAKYPGMKVAGTA